MNEHQRLFLVQAKSDYQVFGILRDEPKVAACHPLHYLQTATELLAKAQAWKHGPATLSHKAFVRFLRGLSTSHQLQRDLGFEGKNESWQHLIRKSIPLGERIERLAPALNPDGPNPEYPWSRANPAYAPAEYQFDLWDELQGSADGRQFVKLLDGVFRNAEAFL